MSRSIIVAVGGTGQLALHYYAQLFQIGSVPDPFHAIIVDSDELLPSLQRLRDFWNVARVAHAQPDLVPRIDYFPVARELGGTVQEALVGRDLPTPPDIHPAEAIFDSTSLSQGVREGLYARPALSAVLQTDWSRFPLASLTGFQRVLVVGSVIGGTGGGLIAPLLSELAARIRAASAIPQPEIRAVFFGEYFELKGDSPVPDANVRYPSNKLMVARCLKDLAPIELTSFVFVEPGNRKPRTVSDERSPVNLSWPSQTDAIWIGISAMEELRTVSAWPAAEDFIRKERAGLPLLNLETCTTTLNDRLGIAQTIHKKTVLKRMTAEPWVVTFYGSDVPKMLAKAAAVANQKPALGVSGVKSLAALVQAEYGSQWNDLGSVFPRTRETTASPAVLRSAGWNDLNVAVPEFDANPKALTSYTSANILHSSLRGSEAKHEPAVKVALSGNHNRLAGLLNESNSWESYTLFGESIPHLLHWDWAYLWIMGRQSPKPRAWDVKIEAWRRLLCMLLLNELQLESVEIEQPLLNYTRPVNLHQMVLVRSNAHFRDKPIGVLSPTVIIRPLPEPNRFGITAETLAKELPKHYDRLPGTKDRRGELSQMLEQAKIRIRELSNKEIKDGGSEFAPRLLELLRTNLQITRFDPAPNVYEGEALPYGVPLLAKADASAWAGLLLTSLTLDASLGGERPQFVPKCRYPSCRRTLTYAETDPVIEVPGNQSEVALTCPVCRQTTNVPLEDLAIWNYEDTTYVWKELETFEGLRLLPLPPSAEIDGNEVWYRWNVLRTGDSVRTHLRLRFPERRVEKVRPADIKYGSLLIPGEFSAVKALPIRPEWLFALNQDPMPVPEIDRDVIVYRNVRLRGVKNPVTLGRYPKAACTVVPELQLGMFPKPMYAEWRRYRFFCSGVDLRQYRMCLMGNLGKPGLAQRKLADIVETNEGLPQAVAVEIRDTTGAANTGATWLLDPAVPSAATPMVYAGVDFGTTNTVVYARSEEYDASLHLGELAINRREILNTASLIAGKGEPRKQFLPILGKQLSDETDISLIPSALWFASVSDGYNPIRWSTDKPSEMHQPLHEFKWKDSSEQLCPAYLEELLFLTLPAALKKLFPVGNIRANWTIGFAFPLAFSDSQRGIYTRLFNSLPEKVRSYTGSTVVIRNINESAACIKAFGTQAFGSMFLIADLGGGSLDVALFEIRSKAEGAYSFQVGSAKIGGEVFMKALSKKYGNDPQSREEQYWRIRDAIMAGGVANAFPGDAFSSLASKFLPIPLELLRVMAEAFRKQVAGKKVDLVLVGNGWRVAEFTGSTPLPRIRALADIEQTIQEFGMAEVSLYKGRLEVPSKHIIAYGALKHAQKNDPNELGDDSIVSESKMPAGREMTAGSGSQSQSIQWFDSVGTSMRILSSGIEASHIVIHRPSGPPAPPKWQRELDHAMPGLDHDPDDAKILEDLGVSSNRIKKGPLQIILEKRAEDLS